MNMFNWRYWLCLPILLMFILLILPIGVVSETLRLSGIVIEDWVLPVLRRVYRPINKFTNQYFDKTTDPIIRWINKPRKRK